MISSLYIHIPFCKSKCHYCAFNSYAGLDTIFDRYCEAVQVELGLQQKAKKTPLKTIFFGGGTPTVLGAERLVQLLALMKKTFGFNEDVEISTEVNPETVDLEYLKRLRSGGFNRISFGVQSFSDADLRKLGRPHTALQAKDVIIGARRAGFENISLDLMSGLAGQSCDDWQQVLSEAIALQPEHLSVYQLTPEEGTPLFDNIKQGHIILPDDEVSLQMDGITRKLCDEAGLYQYEISNYARDGRECRHNINYWHNNEYRAVGAGAVSFVNGARKRRVESPETYCEKIERGETPICESEKLDKEASFRETVIIGLRLVKGVDLAVLGERFNIDPVTYYGDVLSDLVEQKMVEITGNILRVTDKGRPVSNMIMAELV